MKIKYQDDEIETDAKTIGELLSQKGCANAIVEFNGEVLARSGGMDVALSEGDEVNVFRIVGGG